MSIDIIAVPVQDPLTVGRVERCSSRRVRADHLRCLAIGEVVPKLHDGHERQAPRGQARVAPRGEQGGKVLVLKDGPQGIAACERGMAFRNGRVGNVGGVFRHRLDDVRVERHARYPSAAWVQAPERSGAVLCHSPLPRSTLQVRKRVAYIFTT
jgi:hypothetical protein